MFAMVRKDVFLGMQNLLKKKTGEFSKTFYDKSNISWL